MEINIPTNIQLSIPDRLVKIYDWMDDKRLLPMPVCFKHAVIQAMAGDEIKTELIESSPDCYICRDGK